MVNFSSVFSQELKTETDTLLIRQDTLSIDTVNFRRPSTNGIDKKVTYSALGKKKTDVFNKKVILTKNAVVTYGDLQIKADSIVFNMESNLVYAAGIKDSTGKLKGTPVFKEGSQEFAADELTYNIKTSKALAKNIITNQSEGILHSTYSKLLEDGTSNIGKSTYSTCDADTPHFYINLKKARAYPGKKIVSGPGNLVIEGVPLPLFIPFGYFPVQSKKAASGILIPKIGEEKLRGYSLTEGGYYFAINNYFDLTLKGNFYSNGTWMASGQTNYNKLYKYNGSLSFDYAKNISGHKGLSDYSSSTNYRFLWNYNQDAKASPGSRFSANVNMSSSGYDKNNSYDLMEHITTQKQSSVSYSKTWDGTPFNFSASMNHSQNSRDKSVSLKLPQASFNVGRIYPLKKKLSVGETKWYEELQFSYSANLENQINTKDSLLFKSEVWNDMTYGFKHSAPLSLQIRPFKNFSITPSLTYDGAVFTQKTEKKWDPDYFNALKNKVEPTLLSNTTKGLFYGQAINPSISASYSTQVFGIYSFTNPDSRLQTIRHVIKPSVGFSYIPSIKGLSSEMYKTVQTDSLGNKTKYSIYEGNMYSTPAQSSKSGSVSFSLVNILEAKVFDKNDTTGKPKKVALIDNFGINTSYNIFADSMKWGNVSMAMSTRLLDNISIQASSSYSLYAMDKTGESYNKFLVSQNGKPMRLTSFSVGLDFELSKLIQRLSGVKVTENSSQGASNASQGKDQHNQSDLKFDEYGYNIFDVPWSMNINYNFSYSKPGLISSVSQSLSASGNVTITKKMAMTYRSGYDFNAKEITATSIGVTRDLHCWTMALEWTPIGMQMWNFTIRVKASVLGDLKYQRRKDFHDTY
jgi:hypothetical protein